MTGVGMMDCKNALTETGGDMEAAVQILREKGLAKSAKLSDRDNSEGVVAIAQDDTGAALVHLKSETDFVAGSDQFKAEADPEKGLDIFRQIHSIAADEFEIIGITQRPNAFGVVNSKLRNVPEVIPGSWMYPDPAPTMPQTYFYAE